MVDVTALGEVLIDFTEAGTSENGMSLFERNPGGAPANVLVALEHLGHATAFLGKVGADMHGDFLRDVLESEGIDCSGLIRDPAFFTTLAFVALAPTGERAFSFARKPGADTQLAPADLACDTIESSRVFHVGSLSLTDEPARSATLCAIKIAREAGCVLSYDPNYRANLWPSAEAASIQMRSIVTDMDLMKISDEECELMTGHADPAEAASALLAQGPKIVAVTLGGSGALVACADGMREVPGFPADVVDTTGAGDSFWGGFLAAFVESGLAPEKVRIDDAAGFARMGNAVASLCVRGRGGIPSMPSREAVMELLKA
ncbi:carbohydrate kinase family protein [Collinsella tanakaei]|uniref:carbohydrate kinase family protein n=1 Tax=Collinsella tanakaei TaxID=626935 RepID=UPI0025A3C549|nr:PfkB family carbohydrate kinase [Collinsella tanakaei]MDM8299634.1 PfkB family carbohydrate kinase [Collinsella tanakaei]